MPCFEERLEKLRNIAAINKLAEKNLILSYLWRNLIDIQKILHNHGCSFSLRNNLRNCARSSNKRFKITIKLR